MQIRTADWRQEKHVPIIQLKEVKFGEPIEVMVVVGKEIPHPNKPEHHIAWIDLYFVPEKGDTPIQLGRVEFMGHGEMNTWTEPRAIFTVKLPGPGKLVAFAFCNLHGLWKSEIEVR